jgi:hypothetical protein
MRDVPQTRKRLQLGLVALLLALATPIQAQDQAVFAKWWPQFQTAVARHDVGAVVQGAKFPMNWENGPTRNIKTQADLTARFDFYITAEIKKSIATIKPERLPNGIYILTWHARGNEYSLYFRPLGTGFALDGLSEGPP